MDIQSIATQYQITNYGLGHPDAGDLRNLTAQAPRIAAAAAWAAKYLKPTATINHRTASNQLKFIFEHDPAGGGDRPSLSNGAMIVALVLAGLTVVPDGDVGEPSRYVYANVSQRSVNRLKKFIYGAQSWHDQAGVKTQIRHQIRQEVRGKPWRCGSCYSWFDVSVMDVGAWVAIHRPSDHAPKIVAICDLCVTAKTQDDVFKSVFSYA